MVLESYKNNRDMFSKLTMPWPQLIGTIVLTWYSYNLVTCDIEFEPRFTDDVFDSHHGLRLWTVPKQDKAQQTVALESSKPVLTGEQPMNTNNQVSGTQMTTADSKKEKPKKPVFQKRREVLWYIMVPTLFLLAIAELAAIWAYVRRQERIREEVDMRVFKQKVNGQIQEQQKFAMDNQGTQGKQKKNKKKKTKKTKKISDSN